MYLAMRSTVTHIGMSVHTQYIHTRYRCVYACCVVVIVVVIVKSGRGDSDTGNNSVGQRAGVVVEVPVMLVGEVVVVLVSC